MTTVCGKTLTICLGFLCDSEVVESEVMENCVVVRLFFHMALRRTFTTSRPYFSKSVHTVTLLRHGESIWNCGSPRFTGWCDVPLTEIGAADAVDSGHLMGERGFKFDVAFTSSLERAWKTCTLALKASGQPNIEIIRSWRLNERHYGILQGHQKNASYLVNAFGEDQIIEWRRSYHTAPPSPEEVEQMDENKREAILEFDTVQAEQFATHAFSFRVTDPKTGKLKTFPGTESLKHCEERAYGYWKEVTHACSLFVYMCK